MEYPPIIFPVIFLTGTMICKCTQRPQRYINDPLYNKWTKYTHENSTNFGGQEPIRLAGFGR